MPPGKYKPTPSAVERRIPKVVFHPRFGDTVISTSCKASTTEILASYRDLSFEEIFPESAIRADLTKQNHEWGNHRYFYADILNRCPRCRRKYIFFAREQQFWYEVLKIDIRIVAKYCWECAEANRIAKTAYERYQALSKVVEFSDGQLVQLGEDLVILYKAGRLRKFDRLGKLKNMLMKRNVPVEKWIKLKTYIESGQ